MGREASRPASRRLGVWRSPGCAHLPVTSRRSPRRLRNSSCLRQCKHPPSLDRPGATPLKPLVDPFGRAITYLRVSVTDRCDLRCIYCMKERMRFLPRDELLTLEELDRIAAAFVARGVRRLRFTGGEPLVRRGFIDLLHAVSRHLRNGALDEMLVTTNGVQLQAFAEPLARAGIKRINVSLDSLDHATFARISRRDRLNEVLAGIDAAKAAGLKVKINTVALKHDNAHEITDLIQWAHARGFDMTLIETMPMGEIDADRTSQFHSLAKVREDLSAFWTLTDLPDRTGGPARYVRVEETGGRLGFITPLTHNFCEGCSRVRLTCTGKLYLCLGQEANADLRTPLRECADDGPLQAAIEAAIMRRPKGHDFRIERLARPASERHMSVTGG
ncbi:MAG: GTP 3',8-cyclase MoaA [Proteobacteria bacterium]|nr:GTP 3',8-cyclase MoaA [Pseudomonadota bacterium]